MPAASRRLSFYVRYSPARFNVPARLFPPGIIFVMFSTAGTPIDRQPGLDREPDFAV